MIENIKKRKILETIEDAETLINIGNKMLKDVKRQCMLMNITYEIHEELYKDNKEHWF